MQKRAHLLKTPNPSEREYLTTEIDDIQKQLILAKDYCTVTERLYYLALRNFCKV